MCTSGGPVEIVTEWNTFTIVTLGSQYGSKLTLSDQQAAIAWVLDDAFLIRCVTPSFCNQWDFLHPQGLEVVRRVSVGRVQTGQSVASRARYAIRRPACDPRLRRPLDHDKRLSRAIFALSTSFASFTTCRVRYMPGQWGQV